ncbi:uncharacterized protein LOC125205823 [Salvia hispanica]|uniref:uncharacterized protein LOC125205823 n=1 Tax=Salvia hispanica TaxID=49212 RepID=UPI002009D45C|nr:uncharacterized protein LOC125205823 [Salvia hispanica]XP_047960930.1 uncharacterized protein LOC125205823 [Salvia hispanica]
MATSALPRHVVLSVPRAATNTYVYRRDDGTVADGNNDMLSELVKIEIERSRADSTRVHLRFRFTNRYWQKNANDDSIVAVSNKPEEDTTNPSCTLFHTTLQSDNALYLTHVQTGWRVMVNNSTRVFYVDRSSVGAPLGFLNWDSLVKLPTHVAFKGDNGQYLKAFRDINQNYLQFGSEDPNDVLSGHEVSMMRDGHVRIKSDLWGLFWRWESRSGSDWIWADSDDVTANDDATLFWPVKIDENTIALRSAGNSRFCKRYTTSRLESCLHAGAGSMTIEARVQVEELVTSRKIYDVRYRMEDARIFGETPYLGGTTSVINESDEAGSIAVTMTYRDEKSRSFSRSTSVAAGVTTSITAEVPGIAGASVSIMTQISAGIEWSETTSQTVEGSATGTVPVPARSLAVVHYVGTMGTCDVPFSYRQEDRSSTSGEISITDQIDGVFTGVNAYNFQFIVERYQPLD